jgi:hypothetical protein
MANGNTAWKVGMSNRARKGKNSLPQEILFHFMALFMELIQLGPARTTWPHYGKLQSQKKEAHHCHLNKGKPTYVVIWNVLSKQERTMEISYVGTHENAPY